MKLTAPYLFLFLYTGIFLGSAGPAMAGTKEGATEVGASAGYMSTSQKPGGSGVQTDTEILDLNLDLGYFLTKRHEVGGSILSTSTGTRIRNSSTGATLEEDSTEETTFEVFYHYFFNPDGKWTPFIGAQAGLINLYSRSKNSQATPPTHSTSSGTGTSAGGIIGLKYFLSDTTTLDWTVILEQGGTTTGGTAEEVSTTHFLFGLSVSIGGKE